VEAECREAVARFRAVGDRWGAAFALSALGELTALRGDHATSAGHYAEALRLLDELGTSEHSAFFQTMYARQLWLTGDTERAKAVLADALYKARRGGVHEYVAAVEHAQAEIARLEGDLATARALVDRASALAQGQTVSPQWRALLATSMGQLDLAEGDLDAARDHLARAVEAAVASRDAPVVGLVLVAVADLALHCGDPARAATLLAASASVTGGADTSTVDRPRVEAAARAALGDAWFAAAYQRGRDATVGSVVELTGLRPGV
jgi:ATP/maltotriose-dependent transcriptional regulator MalT